MPVLVRVRDEVAGGARREAAEMWLDPAPRTVRELICQRVQQEVARQNASPPEPLRRQVQPEATERLLNGERRLKNRPLDAEEECRKACGAFEAQRVVLLIGQRQALALEEAVELSAGTEITFLRLVPLMGG